MAFKASFVPIMQRLLTAAYVGAKWGNWPGPPPNPPVGYRHLKLILIRQRILSK